MKTNRSLYRAACQMALRIRSRLFGTLIGADAYGHYYYVSKRKDGNGRQERWVLYTGAPDPSGIPATWFGWLHHTCDAPLPSPVTSGYLWCKPHEPNQTGSQAASLPEGAELTRIGLGLSGSQPANPRVWQPSETHEG